MSFHPNIEAPPRGRKRGYTTFKREVEEGGQDVVNLDGDDPLPPVKKRKRTITVIDFTQNDDTDDEDKRLFSPASKPQHHRHMTCMSCNTTKSKNSFPTEQESKKSLVDLGGAICRRCWEANISAEQAHEETTKKDKTQECSICYDTAPTHDFPARPHEGAKNHTVCISCWERHLHTEIERKDWDKLTCPQDGCGKVLSYGEIAFLDGRFEKAIEPILAIKATASYLKQDDTYFACPFATCKSGNFLDDGDEDGIFTCTACNFAFCLSCDVPMHIGQSCEDYQDSIHSDSRRREEEQQSKEEIEGTCKSCICGSKVIKISGCDHVVCLHCKRAFNWSELPEPSAEAVKLLEARKREAAELAPPKERKKQARKSGGRNGAAARGEAVRRESLAARAAAGETVRRMSMVEQLAERGAASGRSRHVGRPY